MQAEAGEGKLLLFETVGPILKELALFLVFKRKLKIEESKLISIVSTSFPGYGNSIDKKRRNFLGHAVFLRISFLAMLVWLGSHQL